jgi:hypothetical protein
MPIDISHEMPITFAEATSYVPRRRRGRKASVTTLYRWATTGVRGILLETIQIGGSRCTSVAALQRFFDRLTQARPVVDVPERNSQAVGHRAHAADRELNRRWQPKGVIKKENS